MLSALIGTEHSYPTLLLAKQLVDQRFVHPGPLVLGTTLLKLQRPHQIRTNLSRACLHIFLCALDYNFIRSGCLTFSLYGSFKKSSLGIVRSGFYRNKLGSYYAFLHSIAASMSFLVGSNSTIHDSCYMFYVTRSHAVRFEPSSRTLLIGEQPNPW